MCAGQNITIFYVFANTGNIDLYNTSVSAPGAVNLSCNTGGNSSLVVPMLRVDDRVFCRYPLAALAVLLVCVDKAICRCNSHVVVTA